MLNTKILALALAVGAIGLTSCRTHAGTGSLIGAGLGSAIGGAVGHHNRHRGGGALIGAGAGALAGYLIGNELDKEERSARYDGDPRYEPGYERYERHPRVRERYYYDYDCPPPRERVIYRERYIYEVPRDPCW